MLAFVAGGAASGKSAWAEALAVALGGKKCYLATMEPFGKEAQERIQKHRGSPAGKRISDGGNLYFAGRQSRLLLL